MLRFRTPATLYICETILKRLAQDLKDMAALGPSIQEEHAMVGPRHRRVVTHAEQSPVRPAILWMRVVSRASAKVMAGRLVVRRRASSSGPLREGHGGGRYRQNACITLSFTIASRGVEGHHR
jgi:hypothetical protein